MNPRELKPVAGSFRDPAGGVFADRQGNIYRTINQCAQEVFEQVEATGLPAALEKAGLLLPARHEDPGSFLLPGRQVNDGDHQAETAEQGRSLPQTVAYVLAHPRIPFISYPYEWGFAQLQRAALLHLEVHIRSLEASVTLADATAYNIQFQGAEPIFIDRLSFIPYQEGMYWAGQKQFAEQFLAPLLLWSQTGIPPQEWYRGSLKGIAIEHVRRLLPWSGKFSLAYLSNIALPAFFERRQQGRPLQSGRHLARQRLPKEGFLFMLRQLTKWIDGLKPPRTAGFWQNYSSFRSYSDAEMARRFSFTADFISRQKPAMLWDLGCNKGDFLARGLQAGATYGVGFDTDHGALASAYGQAARDKLPLLPLYMDLCNPSPDLGWNQGERDGLGERRNADLVLALAILHHIIIGNNVPIEAATAFLLNLAPAGIIEWVPKSDPMVQNMLASRTDIFSNYDIDYFRLLLRARAELVHEEVVSASGRTLFAYQVKQLTPR